jgi:hypothetical protein
MVTNANPLEGFDSIVTVIFLSAPRRIFCFSIQCLCFEAFHDFRGFAWATAQNVGAPALVSELEAASRNRLKPYGRGDGRMIPVRLMLTVRRSFRCLQSRLSSCSAAASLTSVFTHFILHWERYMSFGKMTAVGPGRTAITSPVCLLSAYGAIS